MKEFVMYQLLYAISYSQDLTPLTQMGYNYTQIGILYNQLLQEGYLETVNGEMVLTGKGKARMVSIEEKMECKRGKNKWILPLNGYRIEKIDINAIFIPKHFNKMKIES